MAIYNDFVAGYESGMTMVEIAKRNNVSERTIYRYKAYYDKVKKKEEQTILLALVKWSDRMLCLIPAIFTHSFSIPQG